MNENDFKLKKETKKEQIINEILVIMNENEDLLPNLHVIYGGLIYQLCAVFHRTKCDIGCTVLINMSTFFTDRISKNFSTHPQSTRSISNVFLNVNNLNYILFYKRVINFSSFYNKILYPQNEANDQIEDLKQNIVIKVNKKKKNLYLSQEQLEGVGFFVHLYDSCFPGGILNDPPGMGKSWIALSFLDFIRRKRGANKFLLICPLSIKSKWINDELFIYNKGIEGEELKIDIIHFQEIIKYRNKEYDAIIIDEAHLLKTTNNKKKITQEIKNLTASFVLFITATLYETDFSPFITIIKLLFKTNNNQIFFNQLKFIEESVVRFMDENIDDPEIIFNMASGLIGFHQSIYNQCRLRRPIVKQYSVSRSIVILPLSQSKKRNYCDLLKKFNKDLDLKSMFMILKNTREFINKTKIKLKYLQNLITTIKINNEGEQPNRLVIFIDYIKVTGDIVMNFLIEDLELNKNNVYYINKDSKDIQSIADDFSRNSEFSVMVIGLKIGSVGLDIIGANYIILLEPVWNYTTWIQAYHRVERKGQMRSVINKIIITESTIEEYLLLKSLIGKNVSEIIFDGINYNLLPTEFISKYGSLNYAKECNLKLNNSSLFSKINENDYILNNSNILPTSFSKNKLRDNFQDLVNSGKQLLLKNSNRIEKQFIDRFLNRQIENDADKVYLNSTITEKSRISISINEIDDLLRVINRYKPKIFNKRLILRTLLVITQDQQDIFDHIKNIYNDRFKENKMNGIQINFDIVINKTKLILCALGSTSLLSLLYIDHDLILLFKNAQILPEKKKEVQEMLQNNIFEKYYCKYSESTIDKEIDDDDNTEVEVNLQSNPLLITKKDSELIKKFEKFAHKGEINSILFSNDGGQIFSNNSYREVITSSIKNYLKPNNGPLIQKTLESYFDQISSSKLLVDKGDRQKNKKNK